MINMENIKLDMYNGIKEGVGGNYGFFSVGFDFGYNQSKNRIDELLDKIDMLKFQLKAADSVNENLSKQEEWISVESALPPYYDNCLLANNSSEYDEDNWVVSGYYNHDEEKFYNQFQDKYNDCEIFPTHWMPLPNQPK